MWKRLGCTKTCHTTCSTSLYFPQIEVLCDWVCATETKGRSIPVRLGEEKEVCPQMNLSRRLFFAGYGIRICRIETSSLWLGRMMRGVVGTTGFWPPAQLRQGLTIVHHPVWLAWKLEHGHPVAGTLTCRLSAPRIPKKWDIVPNSHSRNWPYVRVRSSDECDKFLFPLLPPIPSSIHLYHVARRDFYIHHGNSVPPSESSFAWRSVSSPTLPRKLSLHGRIRIAEFDCKGLFSKPSSILFIVLSMHLGSIGT